LTAVAALLSHSIFSFFVVFIRRKKEKERKSANTRVYLTE